MRTAVEKATAFVAQAARAAASASVVSPGGGPSAEEPRCETLLVEKVLDVRTRVAGGAASGAPPSTEAGEGESEYLCKLKGRAHVHAVWMTSSEIGRDGRASVAKLRAWEAKRELGRGEAYNAVVTQAHRRVEVGERRRSSDRVPQQRGKLT